MLKKLGLLLLALSLCAPVTFAQPNQDTGKTTTTPKKKAKKSKTDKTDSAAADQASAPEKTSKRKKKDSATASDETATATTAKRSRKKKDTAAATDDTATTTTTSRRNRKKKDSAVTTEEAGTSTTKATTTKGTPFGSRSERNNRIDAKSDIDAQVAAARTASNSCGYREQRATARRRRPRVQQQLVQQRRLGPIQTLQRVQRPSVRTAPTRTAHIAVVRAQVMAASRSG